MKSHLDFLHLLSWVKNVCGLKGAEGAILLPFKVHNDNNFDKVSTKMATPTTIVSIADVWLDP